LPERLLSRDHAGAIVRSLKGGSHVRGAWTVESLAPYREAFSDVSSAAAALAYYRSAFRHAWQIQRDARAHPIKARTHVLWGREDRFLSVESLRPDVMGELVAPGTVVSLEYVEGAGHFVQNEAPDEVNRKLVAWLRSAE
jgi:pimeloyl-ACP methyl ester carboxylesterase